MCQQLCQQLCQQFCQHLGQQLCQQVGQHSADVFINNVVNQKCISQENNNSFNKEGDVIVLQM